ncbi:MAG: helix-turn-helix domain-containing protein [Clostridium sp.]
MDTFGKRLKYLIDKKEITQAEFALKFHTTPTTIGRYIKDLRFPDQKTLVEISDFFNVSLDYLLCKTDDSKRNIKYVTVNSSKFEVEIKGINKEIDEEKLRALIKKLDNSGFIDIEKLL